MAAEEQRERDTGAEGPRSKLIRQLNNEASGLLDQYEAAAALLRRAREVLEEVEWTHPLDTQGCPSCHGELGASGTVKHHKLCLVPGLLRDLSAFLGGK